MGKMFEKLRPHIGHDIVCVRYGNDDAPSDICIECETCNEVLISAETENHTDMLPKLVRDRIPDIIRANGQECETEWLSDNKDYIKALDAKLDEEVAEYHESHSLDELVDILEVVVAIAYARGYGGYSLVDTRTDKLMAVGGFGKRILLKEIKEKKDV